MPLVQSLLFLNYAFLGLKVIYCLYNKCRKCLKKVSRKDLQCKDLTFGGGQAAQLWEGFPVSQTPAIACTPCVATMPKRKVSLAKEQPKRKKGKQAEVTDQETKEDSPVENRETKNQESVASDEAEEKEAMLTNPVPHLIRAPWLLSPTIQRNIFINYF
jgi:hypothetical protein